MQQQPQREPTFPEKMQMVQNLMVYPALTVAVLLRKNLGYRLLNPLHICGMAFLLFVLGSMAGGVPNHEALQLFAVLVFFFGIAQRIRRWIDARRGIRLHSYYIGDSRFEFKRMPAFLRRNRRFTRLFDPLLCIISGVWLLEPCRPLGLWLLVSGCALRALESSVQRRSQERERDTLDNIIESEVQEEVVERYSMRIHNQTGGTVNGIPTGCSADIEKTILRRKTKRPSSGA